MCSELINGSFKSDLALGSLEWTHNWSVIILMCQSPIAKRTYKQSACLGFNLSGFFAGFLFTHRDRRLLDAIAHRLPCLKAPADREGFAAARVIIVGAPATLSLQQMPRRALSVHAKQGAV